MPRTLSCVAAGVLFTALAAPTAANAAAPTSTITLQVRADLYAGRAPLAKLAVNGHQIATIPATSQWRTVTIRTPHRLTTTDIVGVLFNEDARGIVAGHVQDRNLYVRNVTIDAHALAVSSARFDAGNTWPAATDGTGVSGGVVKMSTNGAVLYGADIVHTRASRSPRDNGQLVTIHVAPAGSGTSCTAAAPCSLDTGLGQVRATSTTATADTNLVLHGGTYRRSAPVSLGDADSGHNGHRVLWTAAPNETPVIDGGRTVTGWSAWSGRAGVYRAQVPAGTRSRQLYVDGVLAQRASAPASEVLGTTAKASDGFTVTKSLAGWSNLADTELVWTGHEGANIRWQAWTQRRCPLVSAAATRVIVSNDCFSLGDPNGTQGIGLPTEVENNLALLTRPGQFYLDSAAGYVYYMPRAGQSMATATAELPRSEGLVRANGVHDLTMRGITFQHDNWLGASTSRGFIDVQAAWFKVSPNDLLTTAPGALQFRSSHRVLLDRLTVRRVAGGAIQFMDGSNTDSVTNTVVTQVASSGIVLGGVDATQTGDHHLTVSGNTVDHVGTQYLGATGIFAGYVSDSSISQNQVRDIPYTGISVGWGWGTPSSLANNHVDQNRIERVMQADQLEDGGAVYVNGTSSGTSTISGNYVMGDPKPYGAIYLDGSASHWQVTRNVVSQVASNWVYVQDVAGQDALYNVITGNWTDSGQAHYASNSTNTISGNQMDLTSWPAQAQAVIAAAG